MCRWVCKWLHKTKFDTDYFLYWVGFVGLTVDYKGARAGTIKAQFTSDIDTQDTDAEKNKSRQRRKRQAFPNEEDDLTSSDEVDAQPVLPLARTERLLNPPPPPPLLVSPSFLDNSLKAMFPASNVAIAPYSSTVQTISAFPVVSSNGNVQFTSSNMAPPSCSPNHFGTPRSSRPSGVTSRFPLSSTTPVPSMTARSPREPSSLATIDESMQPMTQSQGDYFSHIDL